MSPPIMPGSSSATRCSACRPRSITRRCPGSPTPIPNSPRSGRPRPRRADGTAMRCGCSGLPFAENDRAQAERHTEGLVKIVARRNGRSPRGLDPRRACRRTGACLGAGDRAAAEAEAHRRDARAIPDMGRGEQDGGGRILQAAPVRRLDPPGRADVESAAVKPPSRYIAFRPEWSGCPGPARRGARDDRN